MRRVESSSVSARFGLCCKSRYLVSKTERFMRSLASKRDGHGRLIGLVSSTLRLQPVAS